MTLEIGKDYAELSAKTAEIILEQVRKKPEAVLCLAAGDTPRMAYQMLAENARATQLDLSKCTFIGLDEWIGIPPENPGSCASFLATNLFNPLAISSDQTFLFDAMSRHPEDECRKMDRIIQSKGGIDLILVGVGMNGHIGFNEPGVPQDLGAHLVALDDITKNVGQKYFDQHTPLGYGITLGLRHFLESRKAVMIASGEKKAGVIKRALQGPITREMPASIIRRHANAVVVLDEGAASELT